MQISRRQFLRYCTTAATALGLSRSELAALAAALRSPTGPTVVWLEGANCSGCSVSFLNHVSATAPVDVADVLINVINLRYHKTVMASAGQMAVNEAYAAKMAGNYVLVVEGGVPTAFGGRACFAWNNIGLDQPFKGVLQQFAPGAAAILCIGSCSSFGGIPAAPPNPAGIVSVKTLTGRTTINVAGCPPHPAWVVWVIAQLLAGNSIPVDSYGRPTQFYSQTVHHQCPLRETEEASQWGQENRCKEELGCRGPETRGNCPYQLFNGGVNWCIGAGGPCIGCTEPTFPGTNAFYQAGD
jgi:hydrogenase small subunit